MKRASSLFNIFTAEDSVEDSLRIVQEDVEIIKKACKAATKAFKDTLQLKKVGSVETMAAESLHFKSGELMIRKAGMIKHSDSPVKEILKMTGDLFKTFSNMQADFELKIHDILDTGKINDLTTKDYLQSENERNELKRKSSQHTNSKNQFEKELRKLDSAKDDIEYEKELQARTDKAEVDMDTLQNEVTSAEDKLAATLYCLQSNELLYAENILDCVHQIKGSLTQMVENFDAALPAMENVLYATPRRKVFGEDLETHLRTRNVKIAIPLKFAVCGLLDHLHVEGLFRVGPGLLSLKRAKNALDAGVLNAQLRAQFDNPHIFTAVIKAYLRELKDPLFCSKFAQRWAEANRAQDSTKQVELIKKILSKLPDANRTNIGFLFQFLSKLVAEKEQNLMTTDNLAIVVGPNLLWSTDSSTDDAFSINSVVTTMIEEVTEFFPTDLISECDDESGYSLSNRTDSSQSQASRGNSWDNWLSQEKRRYSDENVTLNWKGATGVSNIFRSDTLNTEEGDDHLRSNGETGPKERTQSTDKLGNIREETFVERIADNFETINPATLMRSFSGEPKKRMSDEKAKKSHSRTSSGSSLKNLMSSVNSSISIRRNKSSGHYEDKIKKK